MDKLVHREKKPHFIFASPNIPNPQVYLRLMLNAEDGDEEALAITYSPVVQIKFLVDLKTGRIEVYNEHATRDKSKILLVKVKQSGIGVNDFLLAIETQNQRLPKERRKQSIVYYNGRDKAVNAAQRTEKRPASRILGKGYPGRSPPMVLPG